MPESKIPVTVKSFILGRFPNGRSTFYLAREIIENPILSNFKEGLSILEYFISTHGARKGLADTALKTANSGYLTRRLCDVAQDLTITKKECDCGKAAGSITLSEIIEGGNVIVSLSERALGRVVAADVKNPITGEVIIKKSNMIDEAGCEKIDAAGVKFIKVYSVITCGSKEGVCAMSYGRDLSRGKMVHVCLLYTSTSPRDQRGSGKTAWAG